MDDPKNTIRILLVDDQAITGYMLQRILREASDMTLLSCRDPRQAIEMAEESEPAVILLDFIMPEMDGITLLSQFRALKRFAFTPIILLSSQEEVEGKVQAFKNGANDYLVKLPDPVEMLARLRYHAEGYFNRLKSHRIQLSLIESEQRFRMITQSISEALIAVCPEGMISFWNKGAENIFGYTAFEIYDRPLSLLVPKRLYTPYFRKFCQIRKRNAIDQTEEQCSIASLNKTMELLGIRKNGEEFPMELSVATWKTEGVLFLAAVLRDVTERKQAERKIHYQAHFDVLTDLPNRTLFLSRLDEAISLAGRQNKSLALLFIDLDRFKWVNDTLGHEAGDDLLQQAAQRMKACVRKSDTVARLGGDEFTMILFDIIDIPSTTEVVEKILQHLATPFMLANQEVSISASIGITFYPGDGTDREVLLRNADHAMYIAKRSGRNTFWLFTPDQ